MRPNAIMEIGNMLIPDAGRKTRQNKSASRKYAVSLDLGAARHPSLCAGNRFIILITCSYWNKNHLSQDTKA